MTLHPRFRPLGVQSAQEDLGPYLRRVTWILAALTTLLFTLRICTKLSRLCHLWYDDLILAAAWLSLIVSVILQTVAVHFGLGRLYRSIDDDQLALAGLFSIAAGFASILAAAWSKTSFAMTLLRISSMSRVRVVLWVVIVLTNLLFAGSGMIQWVQCWPVAKLWDYRVQGACWPSGIVRTYGTFMSAFSGVVDILLALLPWKIIWDVNIKSAEKFGAMLAMSMGVFAGVMAFLKIMTIYTIGNADTTTADLFVFGTAEPATAIMAASIPVLRTLIKRGRLLKQEASVESSKEQEESTAPSTRTRKDTLELEWMVSDLGRVQTPVRGL